MALELRINDIDRTGLVLWDSLRWQQNLTQKADTLKFKLNKFGDRTFSPSAFDEVTFWVDGTQVFGGTILDVRSSVEAVDKNTFSITCKDYTHYFDRRLVIERYIDKPVINIICDILNRYANRDERTEIATFENTEIWTGGAQDSDHFRVGDLGRKLTSTNAVAATMSRDILVNLLQTGFTTSDYIEIDVYVDDVDNLDTVVMTLGDDDLTNYFSADVSAQVTSTGWNLVRVVMSAFTETGTIDWEDIARIKLDVTSVASETVVVTFDNWHQLKTTAFNRNNAEGATQVIDFIVFNYEAPSKALQRMAQLFQWNWYIDPTKGIHFFDKFQKSAPFNLSDDGGNYIYNSLVHKDQADQIRNSIFVRGSDYLGEEITENLSQQGDGSNKVFVLGYKYADYSLSVNGTDVPVGVENLQGFTDNNAESQLRTGGTSILMGDVAANEQLAQQVVVTSVGRRASVVLRVKKIGAPVDDVEVQIFADDGSNKPSGTALSAVSVKSASLISGVFTEVSFPLTESSAGDLNLALATKYHIVISRSGAVDASNYYSFDASAQGSYEGLFHTYNGSTWSQFAGNIYFTTQTSFDALYSFNEKIVVFSTAPALSDVILWTAKPYRPIIVRYQDISSIDEVGIFQHRVRDPSIQTREAARQRANEELLAFSANLSDVTYKTYTDGLTTGQTQNVQSDIRGIDDDIIINKITAKAHTPERLEYSVSGSLTRTMDLIYWMQEQIQKDNREIIVDENETLDRIEFLNETIPFSTEYIYTLYVGKFWSNDAGTTPDRLIWDGGPEHIWI